MTLDEALAWCADQEAVVRFTAYRVRVSVHDADDEVVTTYADLHDGPQRALVEAVEELRRQVVANDRRRGLRVV